MHRRKKANVHRRRKAALAESLVIRAARDYRIKPHECCPIEVCEELGRGKEWLVEKNLVANNDSTFFAIPNVLILSEKPWVPVSNTSNHPRFIRQGEAVGTLKDPSSYFNAPRTVDKLREFEKTAHMVRQMVADSQDSKPTATDSPPNEDNNFGPKTAEMADTTTYPSANLEELIDVGDLPDHLKDAAWAMLRRRQGAFGFDGRLGYLKTRAHIRTVDGQVPIAVPMYGTSPAKKEVMDKQLDVWFEQGVIEDSISPWSAPVVIAYRNGKLRFCVDYRKLNAVTIPDEFPIPRQSEILSSTIGDPVLALGSAGPLVA